MATAWPIANLRSSWQQGKATLNCWLSIPSTLSTEILANKGFDSLTVDMQHGPIGFDSACSMIVGLDASRSPSLVRVPMGDLSTAQRVLDAGAGGIILPMVNSAEESREFVSSCRYPPQGMRSIGPTRIVQSHPHYLQEANAEVVLLAQLETGEAIENLEKIVETPGLDGVYVGPADLNASVGRAPVLDSDDRELLETLEKVALSARSAGVIAGIHCGTLEYAKRMIDLGFLMVTVMSDARMLGVVAETLVRDFANTTLNRE